MSTTEYEYERVKISGILHCQSDLHIGDGDLDEFKSRPDDKNRAKGEKGAFNTVCLDQKQKAYIPGSTLRGSLTAFLDEQNGEVKSLFGFEKSPTSTNKGKRQAGKVYIYDAHIKQSVLSNGDKLPYWNSNRSTFIRHGIGIDDITGTVEKGKLFRYELVPACTQFQVEINVTKPTADQLAILLGLLTRWDGSSETSIGKGSSKGYGRIFWEKDEIKISVLSKAALKQWAESDELAPPAYNLLVEETAKDTASIVQRQKRCHFKLNLYPQSPLLCNEPGFVTKKEGDPKQLYYSRDGKATIPAQTLAGAARARGRKILMTLLHQATPTAPLLDLAVQAEELIKQIFGSESQQSALEFTDATDSTAEIKSAEHSQFFIAIDRFTGGVKKLDTKGKKAGALFNVTAALCDQLETGNCYLNINRTPQGDWWKGLLLFIVRDAIEGDLTVGWGKGKGYGCMNLGLISNSQEIASWAALLDLIRETQGIDQTRTWIKALLQKTGNSMQETIKESGESA